MAPMNITLSVVILQENDTWVAQALEYDITAQGKTIKTASDALERTVVGQAAVDLSHGMVPFEGIDQAPKTYWDRFFKAQKLEERKPLRFPVPSPARVTMGDMRVFA